MNVDVYNRTLVFDLLGDIYAMPLSGGVDASLLIGGVAWQSQPRFSPDGSKLLFSSDESGCDNVWVYDFVSGVSRQVTYEPFFYVTNGKWRNATHIVANRWHLVLDRGIAGGEVWQYPVPSDFSAPAPAWGDSWTRNPGVMLAGRTNEYAQFGPEEPFFDVASGRYLYFSRNMADSVRWNYNKDPHAGIYAIHRVDLGNATNGNAGTDWTVADQIITGGPGGAARPIVSQDGQTLAFIKRELFQTTLMLRNLTSGNEAQIFNLNYLDQQESYAPCGVYPSFSFIENNNPLSQNTYPTAIITWAGGKLWNISLPISIDYPNSHPAPAPPNEITFNVSVHKDMAPVTRFQQNAKGTAFDEATSTFITKVALHPSRNPSVSTIAFSSLGQIYTAKFTGGGAVNRTMTSPTKFVSTVPAGIDSNQTIMYYWPYIDNLGTKILKSGWSDVQYGWVEMSDLSTLTSVLVTTEPGRYVKPTFNLDANRILFSKASGDGATGSRFSNRPGIYVSELLAVAASSSSSSASSSSLSVKPSVPRFLCDGEWAEWTVDGGSALVVRSSSYPYVVDEVSTDVPTWGQTVRPFAVGQYVTNLAVNDRLQVVAFVEFEIVYVQQIPFNMADSDWPLKVTARLDNAIGSGATQILSKVGGDFLQFHGDSLSFGWANNFTTVDVSPMKSRDWSCPDQYCFMNAQYMQSFSLGLNVSLGTATETLVLFTNATIIPLDPRNDSSSQYVFDNQQILVRGDVIDAIGVNIAVPAGATVIDLQGGVVLPGFIDAHAHWDSAFVQRWGKSAQGWEFLMNLAFGVTTVHNPSAEFWSVWTDAELVRAGMKIGPRVFSTATAMFGAGGEIHCEVATVSMAQEALQRRAAFGGFSAKSYMIQCRAGRQKVLEAARRQAFLVVPEGGMHFAWDLSFVVDGHTTVEHSLPMAPFYADIMQMWNHSQTAWTPTMVVSFGGLWGDRFFYQNSSVFLDPTVQQWIPNDVIRPTAMRRTEADKQDYHVFTIAKTAANFETSGLLVNVGAHGQMQGIGYLWELKLFKEGGLTNYQVLKTATINPATSLGLDSQIGSVYPRKLADLLFLQPGANPLQELDALRQLKWVMKDGKMWDVSNFEQVLPNAAPAPTLTVTNTPNVAA